jgi:hypothetical protein
MTQTQNIKETRAQKAEELTNLCQDVSSELYPEVTEDQIKAFLQVLMVTVIDHLGYLHASVNYYEAVAELAIILQMENKDVKEVFSEVYKDVPPKELYELYTKQKAAAEETATA